MNKKQTSARAPRSVTRAAPKAAKAPSTSTSTSTSTKPASKSRAAATKPAVAASVKTVRSPIPFLKNKSATYKAGLAVRSEVLGKEYVEQRFAEADSFNADLQDFVTEHAWGAIWARPGLPRKIRSLLVLAMTTALNRPHELEIHVRGALNNGVTPDEMKELFLQAAVYAGAPAALDGFRVARKVLKEQGKL